MQNKPSFIIVIICILAIVFTIIKINSISNYLADILENNNNRLLLESKNSYYKDEDYEFVQISKDFNAYSKQDLKNIIYTIVNSGWRTFTFYCPKEYTKCVDDVTALTDDQETMTHLNNFVHPFNSFSNIKTTINENGQVDITIEYLYTEQEINEINKTVNDIITSVIKDDMDEYEKIKIIHDYIIEHSKYDVERNNNLESQYNSYKAYGPLIHGYATCNGYTDAMAIFLSKLGIKNYKIATTPKSEDSTGHIWNAIYYNNKWLHIDATWDDPVGQDGKDYLLHKYFLVTTEEMNQIDAGDVTVEEHNFLKKIYSEYK